MGKESKIRELRRARIIPQVKHAKIYKPMSKGWRITIWSIILLAVVLFGLGIWAYTSRDVEARVGGKSITTSELEARALQLIQQQVPQDQIKPGTAEFDNMLQSAKQQALSALINEKLFLVAGERAGVKVDDKELEEEAQKVIDMQKPPQGVDEWVQKQGFKNMAEMRDFIVKNNREGLLTQIYMTKLFKQDIPEVKVTDEEAKKWYNSYGQLKLAHILFTYDATKDPADKAATQKAEIEKVLEQVKKDPKTFMTIAKEKSQDPSAKTNSGDLGWYTISGENLVNAQNQGLVPEFTKAALQLSKGQISPVVQSQFGFHIIYLENVKTNGESFNVPESARIGFIKFNIANPADATKPPNPDEVKAKTAESQRVIKEIQSGKITFEQAVAKYSEDQLSKDNGGELPSQLATDKDGHFWAELSKAKELQGQGAYPFEPQVVEAAWGLKKGQITSKPVVTDKEINIVRLIDKRSFKTRGFDEVKQDVITQLKNERNQKAQSDWVTNKRNELGVSNGNPWKSFSTWWQNTVVAPFGDFGQWVAQLMGKGGPMQAPTTTTPTIPPTGAGGDVQLTPEQQQQLMKQLQQQGGGLPPQQSPTPQPKKP